MLKSILKSCCNAQIKFYNSITCRTCWECQSCELRGCDKIMYGHAPMGMNMEYLVDKFLQAHSTTDSTGGYEPSDSGATPDEPKDSENKSLWPEDIFEAEDTGRGLDCSVVIMRVGEITRVYMRNPVTLHVFCDNNDVEFHMQKVTKGSGHRWALDIGPIDKPLTATITIDNQKLPLIVTT